jgi:hypothetical protein
MLKAKEFIWQKFDRGGENQEGKTICDFLKETIYNRVQGEGKWKLKKVKDMLHRRYDFYGQNN